MILTKELTEKLKDDLFLIEKYLTVELVPLLQEPLETTFGAGGCYNIHVTAGGCEREVQLWRDAEYGTGEPIIVRNVEILSELRRKMNERDWDMLIDLVCEWQDIKMRLLRQKENTEQAIKAIKNFKV